jgi:uncharacterized FAD-dependent dehydrogenase
MSKRKSTYDLIIVGGGLAGAFSLYRLSEECKDMKICLVEFGRVWRKRKSQLCGYLGAALQSSGKLYLQNLQDVSNISNDKSVKSAKSFVNPILSAHGNIKQEKNKEPSSAIKDLLTKQDYSLSMNDYIQWYPSNFHLLSRTMSSSLEENPNLEFMFDNEALKITKTKNMFTVETETGNVYSKNVLFCVGRSGWRQTKDLFYQFGLVNDDDYCSFGFKGEISTSYMKEWNSSHCTITKDNFTIGPFCWNGTIVPEDHCDLVIANWRDNEARWNTDKVSFSILVKQKFEGKGLDQLERLSKLAYILSDNRVHKEKIKDYLNGNFDLVHIPEYKWFIEQIKEINNVIPNFSEKASLYIPDIKLSIPKININQNFETDIPGLYVAGESAGLYGLYSAMLSGTTFANAFLRK